jgi:hypothetical protein
MPTYLFYDTETGEEFESFMKISERESFLKENQHITAIISAPSIVSGVTTSKQNRVPDGFKEVLSKISEKNRGTELADKYGKNSIKEARTNEVVKKHIDKVAKRTTQ